VASVSFLIAVTRREQVAQIFGKPIYVVTDVALVPLSSQSEAEKGVAAAVRQRETAAGTDEDLSDAESTGEESDNVHSAEDAQEAPSPTDDVRTKSDKGDTTATTNIAEDVFVRRGPYGKFASQWLTKIGWGLPGMRTPSRVLEATPEPDLHRYNGRQRTAQHKRQIRGKLTPWPWKTLRNQSPRDKTKM
jgi:hypothetical protein